MVASIKRSVGYFPRWPLNRGLTVYDIASVTSVTSILPGLRKEYSPIMHSTLEINSYSFATCLICSAKLRPMPMVEFPTNPLGQVVHLYPGCMLIQVAWGEHGKYKHWKTQENSVINDENNKRESFSLVCGSFREREKSWKHEPRTVDESFHSCFEFSHVHEYYNNLMGTREKNKFSISFIFFFFMFPLDCKTVRILACVF